jgi:N-sulfoglucosamine sulfohydrolase
MADRKVEKLNQDKRPVPYPLRIPLKVALVVVGVCVGATALQADVEQARSARPNVLLIVSEDTGPHLGCYGDRNVETPNLDKLASHGVRWNRAYVSTPSCSESRSSILTGLYPHQNGQIGLATHKYATYRAFPNIPGLLKEHGYRTGIIGKLHVNPEPAFDFDFQWKDPKFCSFTQRDVRKIAEVADTFIAASDQPFFLMVNYPDAHLPFLEQEDGVPREPLTAEDVQALPFIGVDTQRLRKHVAGYYNCISRLDTGIGMLLDRLAGANKSDNTLTIYLSDHGAQFSRGKLTCYESGVRVPLIVRPPGKLKTEQARNELIETVDLLPTILDVVGVEIPSELPGRSFLPLMHGKSIPRRQYAFTEYHSHYPPMFFPQRTVRNGRYKLIVSLLQDRPNPVPSICQAHRTVKTYTTASEIAGSGKEVRRAYETWRDAPPVELYDLENDPYEFVNLAGSPDVAEVQIELMKQLHDWQKRTQDPLADLDKLARLSNEHATAIRDDYKANDAFKWKYGQYLPEHGRGRH